MSENNGLDGALAPGTQIAYIPMHANADIEHPDVEFGFVSSVSRHCHDDGMFVYFCRFWRKGEPGQLRTVANSETCVADTIVEHVSVDQEVVERTREEIKNTQLRY